MRQWDKQPSKPQVKAMVDRRQILLGSLTLLCMAVLMIVGLTPRTASAPQAVQHEAEQVGSDASLFLLESCQVIQHMTYTPCGHSLTRRERRQVMGAAPAGSPALDSRARLCCSG